MWLQRFEIDDEFRMFGSLILYDEGSTKVLLPFQIIVSLIFFYSKFDHSSYSKNCVIYHFFVMALLIHSKMT